ncbi:MAG: uracil phosphoribosyltransferase, partial [Alphaproteobacteria bacterium]|nr:uracil phosphoribosyltransferase [Alphaproteobacteria bacterium]
MSRFHIVEHPLIAHKMSVLRNKETKSPLFRQTLREVAYLMTFA